MRRGTQQRELGERLERVESGAKEVAAAEATAALGVRGLHPGAGASGAVEATVSAPPLPVPRELARAEQRPFVGRAEPLRRLRERWLESSRRHGSLVALGGEPGIGKTRLAARLAAEVHAEGSTVLYGRADEAHVSPYEPFVESLRHCAAHRPGLADQPGLESATELLGGLIPELGRSTAPAAGRAREHANDRQKLFE